MKLNRLIYIFALVLAIPAQSASPADRIELSADRSKVQIGERVIVKLRTIGSPDVKAIIKPLVISDSARIIRSFPFDTTFAGKERIVEMKTEITSFDGMKLTIMPQVVVLEKPGFKDLFITKSNSMLVEFVEVKVDTALPPKTYYGKLDKPSIFSSKGTSIYYYLAIIIVIASVGVFIWLRRRKQLESTENIQINLTNRLKQLKKGRINGIEDLKLKYAALSQIFNEVVASIVGAEHSELLTNDTVKRLEGVMANEDFKTISLTKRRIELVQFASKTPAEAEFIEDCNEILRIVNQMNTPNE